jgi:hypothetical protein
MSTNIRNLILSVLSLGILVGYWYLPGWKLERGLRQAAYKRYAKLGDPDEVKRVVDKNHAEIFDDCFVDGMSHQVKNFDVIKYRSRMDQRVQKDLGEALAGRLVEALGGSDEAPAVPAAPVRPTAPTPPTATSTSTSKVHPVEIASMQVKPAAPTESEAGMTGKLFEIQIDVKDDAHDIPRDSPDLELAVRCPSGEPFSTRAPLYSGMPAEVDGVLRMKMRLLVPESTAGTGNGLCELGARIKDGAGNASEESKRFVALR